MLFTLALSSTFTGALVSAAPVGSQKGCDLSNVQLNLTQNAIDAGFTVPSEGLAFVALGRGVQNYTCVDGVYDNNMAVASLYDASCSNGTDEFGETQTQEALAQANPSSSGQCSSLLGLSKLGDHFFQKIDPHADSASPTFDFRSTGAGDYVSVSKEFSADAEDSTKDVGWLQLAAIDGQGTLALQVYRSHTAGGVPADSCSKEGKVVAVDYSAYYWFYTT